MYNTPRNHKGNNQVTCDGVQGHFQHMPSNRLWAGSPHTFVIQSQSALTSTRQALINSRGFFLQASVVLHGEPSCLQVGHTPVARICRNHLMTWHTSIHVSFVQFFAGRAVTGIRMAACFPVRPGMLRLTVSMVSDLSQLQGVPSVQIPKPKSSV